MVMKTYELNEAEQATLDKWLNSKIVKTTMKKGAKLSLTFSETGIGRHVQADLDRGVPPTQAVLYPAPTKDITDYTCW